MIVDGDCTYHGISSTMIVLGGINNGTEGGGSFASIG